MYPTNEQGLNALRVKPEGVDQWNGPYLPKDVPNDPWGRAYMYKFPGEHGEEPEIESYGADGQPGGDGINADIVSWK
jgi:general secretion pathway protein G